MGKKIVVENCDECADCKTEGFQEGDRFCEKTGMYINARFDKDFPDWCPLEDAEKGD